MQRAISQSAWCRNSTDITIALATLHVHLDDDNCMEMTALRGAADEVKHFADHIIAERGVRYGRVVMIPTGDGKAKVRKHAHKHG
jgi:CopG family transcriptional regulator, nickel-responsive regulator